jgi:hypothetical protein
MRMRHVKPDDVTIRCPGCGRRLALGTPVDGVLAGSCPNDACNQRTTFHMVQGRWIVYSRETMPAAIRG